MRQPLLARLSLLCACALLHSVAAAAATTTLTIGTTAATAGAPASVPLTLTNAGSPLVAAITTDITYDPASLAPDGVATPLAGKVAQGNVVAPGTYRVTVYGGIAPLADGVVARVSFATTAGTCETYALGHAPGAPTASDAVARAVAVTGLDGSVATAGCEPPGCASGASPPDGATADPGGTTLRWGEVLGATVYDVFLGTGGPDDPAFAASVVTPSFDPGPLAQAQRHWWRVVPRNDSGAAAGCPVWHFDTARRVKLRRALPTQP